MNKTHKQTGEIFARLLEEWRRDTLFCSDENKVLLHPSHLKIIGLGPAVLPFIFEDLQNGGSGWNVALESLTHINISETISEESKFNIQRQVYNELKDIQWQSYKDFDVAVLGKIDERMIEFKRDHNRSLWLLWAQENHVI